jgi:DNA repair protein RecO
VPIIDDDALVLDHHPFRDRALVVSVLCRHHGVLRGVLRGARGGRAPFAAAAQVLSLVRASLFQKPTAELATFRSLDLLTSSYPLARSIERSAAGAVVAELLTTFCPPGEPMERAFRLGAAALDALLGEIATDTVVAYVEYWLLTLAGVMPPAETMLDSMNRHDLEHLVTMRRLPLEKVPSPLSESVIQWLDRRAREEAERPLRALTFLRQTG